MTSNRTRELHDALKRRCLYHWIAFPDASRERRSSTRRCRGSADDAAASLVAAVAGVRGAAVDQAARASPRRSSGPRPRNSSRVRGAAWPEALRRSLGLLLKEQEDTEAVLAHAEALGLA